MTVPNKPPDGELIFAAGLLAGSLDRLKGPVQEQVERVVQWLISLVVAEGETGGEKKT